MSDHLEELHAQAFLDLLRANGAGALVFDGQVVRLAEPPYYQTYTWLSWPLEGAANALDGYAVTGVFSATLHSVGESAAAARALLAQARASLLNVRPDVPGRVCGLIRLDEVLAPQRDESTGRLVMDAVSTWSFISAPG